MQISEEHAKAIQSLHAKARDANYIFTEISKDVEEYTNKDWNNAITNGVLFDQKGNYFKVALSIQDKYIHYVDTDGDEGLRYYDSLTYLDLLHIVTMAEILAE